MTNEVETRSQRRRILLMVMASAFLVWQVPAMDFFDSAAIESGRLKGLLSGAGFLVWAGGLVVLLASGRAACRGENAAVTAALEDELVRSNRSRAFVIGYMVTLLATGVIFTLNLIKPLTGLDAAHLILVIAVVTPMFAFVFLERPSA